MPQCMTSVILSSPPENLGSWPNFNDSTFLCKDHNQIKSVMNELNKNIQRNSLYSLCDIFLWIIFQQQLNHQMGALGIPPIDKRGQDMGLEECLVVELSIYSLLSNFYYLFVAAAHHYALSLSPSSLHKQSGTCPTINMGALSE